MNNMSMLLNPWKSCKIRIKRKPRLWINDPKFKRSNQWFHKKKLRKWRQLHRILLKLLLSHRSHNQLNNQKRHHRVHRFRLQRHPRSLTTSSTNKCEKLRESVCKNSASCKYKKWQVISKIWGIPGMNTRRNSNNMRRNWLSWIKTLSNLRRFSIKCNEKLASRFLTLSKRIRFRREAHSLTKPKTNLTRMFS